MPRLAVFIPARDEREDGLIFKRHMWLAYSKSADELGEAVVGHAAAASTTDYCHSLLTISSSSSALPCVYLKMTDGPLSPLCRPSSPTCASYAACGGGEAFAPPFRPLCCCCCHMIASNWLDIKGDLSRKSLRPSLRLSLVRRRLPLDSSSGSRCSRI